MKLISRILLTTALLFGGFNLSAQSLERYKQQLATPESDSLGLRVARITVSEDSSAAEAVQRLQAQNNRQRLQGWRICIFSDNTPDAREGASKAMALFREHFPTIPLYDQYASPYFRVSVGNCTTPEEAIILLEHLKPLFPKAFMKQEQFTLSDLLKEEDLIRKHATHSSAPTETLIIAPSQE